MRCGGFGGVSRAAKGADCKSAGYAFAGSSPASPTNRNYLPEIISFFALQPAPFHEVRACLFQIRSRVCRWLALLIERGLRLLCRGSPCVRRATRRLLRAP